MSRETDTSKNDELREERQEQGDHRQHLRDEAVEDVDGGVADFGSQDERREDGLGPI